MLTAQQVDTSEYRRLRVNHVTSIPGSTDGGILVSFDNSAFAIQANSSWLEENGLKNICPGLDIYVKGDFGNSDGDLISSKKIKIFKK